MTCYNNQQLKKEVSVNPLIVSSPLQNKCDGQQFTAKYQKEEGFFSRPLLPSISSALQFPLTERPYNEQSPAFHLGEKTAPEAFHSLLPPTLPPPLSLSKSTL